MMEKIVCIFGAGETGRFLIKTSVYKELLLKYNNVYFYDNNTSYPDEIEGIKVLKTKDELSGLNVVIASKKYWYEIHKECILNDNNVIGIFDEDTDTLVDYKTLCIREQIGYENKSMIKFKNLREKDINEKIDIFKSSKNLFGCITEVAIMLSNLCNYATAHPQCPASIICEKDIMPLKTVYNILDELSGYDYKGLICFHIYNEPMIDPRLFLIIKYAKEKMPECQIRVYSNGYFINQHMIGELYDIGVDILNVTGYGAANYSRLVGLDVDYPFSVILGNLDDRTDWYTSENASVKVFSKECHSFISQVCIYSNGEIGICCLDWKTPYQLGNIYKKSLKDIINDKRVVDFQLELLNGDRSRFSLCRNCHWSR